MRPRRNVGRKPPGARDLKIDVEKGVTLAMVLVPAGEFVMGDADDLPDEQPLSAVKIDKPFYMGQLEISNALYARFARYSGMWCRGHQHQQFITAAGDQQQAVGFQHLHHLLGRGGAELDVVDDTLRLLAVGAQRQVEQPGDVPQGWAGQDRRVVEAALDLDAVRCGGHGQIVQGAARACRRSACWA